MNEQVAISAFETARVSEMRQTLADCAASPDGAPQGLPGYFYNDPAFFDHECRTFLRDGWHCVGRADEYVEQGDYLALELLGEPLIIVRDKDEIKALSNVCRHRGMPLAEGQGNANRFVCRYHAWAYGTDGTLLRAPRMKNAGFDAKTCKLGTFPCVQRFGFVYVSLSQNPADIDVELAGLGELIGRYEPEKYVTVHSDSEVWNCNWKCLVENFMEGYHLSVVHPQTLHGYTPTGLSKKGPNGVGFTSYFANYPDNIPPRGEGAPGLSEKERHRSTLFAAFPCQVVSVAASLLVSLNIRPLSPTSIRVRWSMSVYGDSLDGDTIDQRIALWEDVNREDREKLEAMQAALGSVFATGGPLAEDDYEGTVRDFLLWIARQDAA
ncbi:2-halobenzoate 1,2-dioxygenase large subunit [Ascidiaceihabitans donghaensis]|uniref:2-halobenzoate 1,2-dioxygenase large subunit n=1 Tax=Ascidiaceihabitans donghaensis TaxID=1510460 RepID=A0A2R8BP79_9RHOB|nr:SRPBCC family protein [Ascidiaceihabitans donghaensis]SPH27323.1 2-halobenzoate 1,2-dioxygenase large subunit [Ascidiaceihabitans donghaensis]